MCKKLPLIFLFALLLGSLLVSQEATLSPKDNLINRISEYQTSLLLVKSSLLIYEQQILSYKQQISNLQQQLNDSNDKAQQIIADLMQQLTASKMLLEKQQAELEKLQTSYNQLSRDLKVLKVSYEVSRNITSITICILGGVGVYECGKALKWWK